MSRNSASVDAPRHVPATRYEGWHRGRAPPSKELVHVVLPEGARRGQGDTHAGGMTPAEALDAEGYTSGSGQKSGPGPIVNASVYGQSYWFDPDTARRVSGFAEPPKGRACNYNTFESDGGVPWEPLPGKLLDPTVSLWRADSQVTLEKLRSSPLWKPVPRKKKAADASIANIAERLADYDETAIEDNGPEGIGSAQLSVGFMKSIERLREQKRIRQQQIDRLHKLQREQQQQLNQRRRSSLTSTTPPTAIDSAGKDPSLSAATPASTTPTPSTNPAVAVFFSHRGATLPIPKRDWLRLKRAKMEAAMGGSNDRPADSQGGEASIVTLDPQEEEAEDRPSQSEGEEPSVHTSDRRESVHWYQFDRDRCKHRMLEEKRLLEAQQQLLHSGWAMSTTPGGPEKRQPKSSVLRGYSEGDKLAVEQKLLEFEAAKAARLKTQKEKYELLMKRPRQHELVGVVPVTTSPLPNETHDIALDLRLAEQRALVEDYAFHRQGERRQNGDGAGRSASPVIADLEVSPKRVTVEPILFSRPPAFVPMPRFNPELPAARPSERLVALSLTEEAKRLGIKLNEPATVNSVGRGRGECADITMLPREKVAQLRAAVAVSVLQPFGDRQPTTVATTTPPLATDDSGADTSVVPTHMRVFSTRSKKTRCEPIDKIDIDRELRTVRNNGLQRVALSDKRTVAERYSKEQVAFIRTIPATGPLVASFLKSRGGNSAMAPVARPSV